MGSTEKETSVREETAVASLRPVFDLRNERIDTMALPTERQREQFKRLKESVENGGSFQKRIAE